MIKIWYRHHGQLPRKSQIIAEDIKKASTLPSSFEIVGVEYGRKTGMDDGGRPIIDSQQFALRVDPPSDNISTDAVSAIATAFEDNWGGSIEHVETVQL
jgi:hypothetical protein